MVAGPRTGGAGRVWRLRAEISGTLRRSIQVIDGEFPRRISGSICANVEFGSKSSYAPMLPEAVRGNRREGSGGFSCAETIKRHSDLVGRDGAGPVSGRPVRAVTIVSDCRPASGVISIRRPEPLNQTFSTSEEIALFDVGGEYPYADLVWTASRRCYDLGARTVCSKTGR